ncbi:GTP:adenosylcobinamide-phosphate guanylyltransferase [Nitrosomonas marina]|uniref:GTP:adenosylcobinamide-phosphate guanylyltransferase n=1 Tax=Nitrosomonas marina TaxID=917 RepID=A0A1I0D0E4_9PROT|nr:nucleotidyltransferase family protein [Nitrosomonas marina]SET25539.1 GTP:adenosylcobinamide-phosphate guanylyltransferase [Nitrosomonas marina]
MTDSHKPVQKKFTALVLAADRTADDPITRHTGVACKAFASVGGQPMIIRVLDALTACNLIDAVVLCGPSRSRLDDCLPLKTRIESGEITWLPNKDSPSRSAEYGFEHLAADTPVLLTTADHALLTPQTVQYFLTASLNANSDATVGLVRQAQMTAVFPNARRTFFHLRDGSVCGCNLFTFNPGGRTLVGFWRSVEDLRKQPWRLIARFVEPGIVLSYLFRRLSLNQALHALAVKSGVCVTPIMLPDARAGIDVDNIEDLLLAESILNKATVPFYKRS